jgi:hypothetical protein
MGVFDPEADSCTIFAVEWADLAIPHAKTRSNILSSISGWTSSTSSAETIPARGTFRGSLSSMWIEAAPLRCVDDAQSRVKSTEQDMGGAR